MRLNLSANLENELSAPVTLRERRRTTIYGRLIRSRNFEILTCFQTSYVFCMQSLNVLLPLGLYSKLAPFFL